MSTRVAPSSRGERRWGEFGAFLGVAMALALSARLIQVQTSPGRGGLPFALVYAALLMAPFAFSLAAIRRRWQRTRAVLLVSGFVAIVVGFASLVTWLLFLPAMLLILAAVRREGGDRGE